MKKLKLAIAAAIGLLAAVVYEYPTAQAQVIIVDHNSVDLFDQIPEQYVTAALNTRVMFVDRSVGGNIWQYSVSRQDSASMTPPGCLTFSSTAVAQTRCKRWTHPGFSYQPGEYNSPPQLWARPGGYTPPVGFWQYYGWPGSGIPPELPCAQPSTGMWWGKPECFLNYVDAYPNAYQVYGWMPSYLEVSSGDIASHVTGYFAPQANRTDITDIEALQARHPNLTIFHSTSSLARGIGTQVATDFNNQMRGYVQVNGGILFDVADIESHDPYGAPCYDNRDGVPYYVTQGTTTSLRENYANDGINQPAICQHYTSEHAGGHLGSPSAGGIRIAKALIVMAAQIAGWNPNQ